jgi:molybdopterin molybdotransferase
MTACNVLCQQDGFECIDLGIIRDTRSVLEQQMQAAAERCDVVITSGGVSMGDADFVKGILQSIGTVSAYTTTTTSLPLPLTSTSTL